MGGAQTAYGRLPAEAKGSYAELTKALKGRFEPEAVKERHLTQFQDQKKTKTEDWAEFADAVKLLCDNAPINDIPHPPPPLLGTTAGIDRAFVSQFLPHPWGDPGQW